MLGERLRHCKNAAARPQSSGARTRSEGFVELGEAGGRDRAVPTRHGLERYIELVQALPQVRRVLVDEYFARWSRAKYSDSGPELLVTLGHAGRASRPKWKSRIGDRKCGN